MNGSFPYTETDHLVADFASRGLVVLSPDVLGVDEVLHERIYRREKEVVGAGEPATCSRIPDILQILNSPGLVAACNRLIGENWAIVPFTHNAPFPSGGRDQHWHKDDNGPYNGRKQRHHQAVQIEMLYYPGAVGEQMGPTATVPYSQYWTFNHEENHDNFAGADHLDFDYQLSGMEREPVSGKDSNYDVEDILHARTAHDVRMREAVTNTGWPLVTSLEAAPLRPGSIVIYSHNTFHRGNHRRDDWRTWADHPRFMWRFWLYRTTETRGSAAAGATARWQGVDELTGVDLSSAPDDATTLWRYHHHWMQTGQPPPPRPEAASLALPARTQAAEELFEQLHAKGDAAEPARIGAAYKLASIGDTTLATRLLGRALSTDRESVRRAATYGLIAVGEDATDVLLEAARSPVKWIRKAGVYGIGDASPLNRDTLNVTVARLSNDESVYVRAVAAGTLGCLGRRAAGTGQGTELIPRGFEALVASLQREKNRLAMDRAQGRSIKFARPTDDSDVCEGGGVDFGLERFKPVRSAVRENALWSLVILSSHGSRIAGSALEPTIACLKQVIAEDANVICVGLAQDALSRLAHLRPGGEEVPDLIGELQAALPQILRSAPLQGWEALVRGGFDASNLAAFSPSPPPQAR